MESIILTFEASSCLLQRSWCLGDTPRFLALMVSVYRVGLRSYVHIYMAGPMLSGVAYIEICTDNVDPRLTLFQNTHPHNQYVGMTLRSSKQ